MNIPTAISVLKDIERGIPPLDPQDLHAAVLLGIEALELVKAAASIGPEIALDHLPSETE